MSSGFRNGDHTDHPDYESYDVGFRVGAVPEPGSLALLLVGGLPLIAYGWRRRQARFVGIGIGLRNRRLTLNARLSLSVSQPLATSPPRQREHGSSARIWRVRGLGCGARHSHGAAASSFQSLPVGEWRQPIRSTAYQPHRHVRPPSGRSAARRGSISFFHSETKKRLAVLD